MVLPSLLINLEQLDAVADQRRANRTGGPVCRWFSLALSFCTYWMILRDSLGSLLPSLLSLVTAPKSRIDRQHFDFSHLFYQLFSFGGESPVQADPQWQHRAQHQKNLPVLMTSSMH